MINVLIFTQTYPSKSTRFINFTNRIEYNINTCYLKSTGL